MPTRKWTCASRSISTACRTASGTSAACSTSCTATVEIRTLPGDIPASIDIDVTSLAIGNSVFVRDISLAKGEILDEDNVVICTVVAPRVEEVVEAPVEDETVEPELIRKPKDDDDEDDDKE